jgi:hypothetical protein
MMKNYMFLMMSSKRQVAPSTKKLRYEKELEIFTQWQAEKRIKGIEENVMIAYLKNIGADQGGRDIHC